MSKYQKFKADALIDKDPLMRWCPKQGCKGTARAESLDAQAVECNTCHTKVCFQCRDEYHAGVSCEKAMEDKLEGWVQ